MRRWAPPPEMTVSQWADSFRYLSKESSAEPGRWDTSRAEYQRGVMDAVSDPLVETVVLMTSSQVGKTEIINNVIGFHMHWDPCPILIVQPTIVLAQSWSRSRFAPMIRDTPALRDKVAKVKSRDSSNTLLEKDFEGGHITMAGANSPASLASRPIRLLLADEVDRFPISAGTEGDPLDLARKRTNNFWNRKIIESSTPTVSGASRIEASYEQSDKRAFLVPCPDCGEEQTLKWTGVRWPENAPRKALYHCSGCGSGWTDEQRWAAVKRGRWHATAPFNGVAGFHLNELCSTWSRLYDMVKAFRRAKDNPERLKVFINTVLGEPSKERGAAPDWKRLYDRRETWTRAPGRVGVITAGVDVQRDRLEVSIWGWGQNKESWLISHEALYGKPEETGVWEALRDFLSRPIALEDGRYLGVSAAGIDSGDGVTTSYVYDFVRRDRRCHAVKGQDNLSAAVGLPSRKDVSRSGKRLAGLKVWPVGSSFIKAETYGFFNLESPTRESGEGFPEGFIHLSDNVASEEICRQLVSEKQAVTVNRKTRRARLEWVKDRERNEALDCRVYARAMLTLLGADRWSQKRWSSLTTLDNPQDEDNPTQESPAEEPAAETPSPVTPSLARPRRFVRRVIPPQF